MEASNSSFNIATIMLVGMFVLVIVSFVTLAIYFFGGRTPLERNALGRIENALAPADVLRAHREFRSQRMAAALVVFFIAGFFLHQAAPVQTEQATTAFFEAVSITLGAAKDAAVALGQELGIGNE
jgi:hypothetical protein